MEYKWYIEIIIIIIIIAADVYFNDDDFPVSERINLKRFYLCLAWPPLLTNQILNWIFDIKHSILNCALFILQKNTLLTLARHLYNIHVSSD